MIMVGKYSNHVCLHFSFFYAACCVVLVSSLYVLKGLIAMKEGIFPCALIKKQD